MSDVGELRAALKRCHALLETASNGWEINDGNEKWHEAVEAELLPCDVAGSCPPAAKPAEVCAGAGVTEGELAKAMHAERLEREGCRSNYADERWDESKADRERWYASARVAMRMMGGEK